MQKTNKWMERIEWIKTKKRKRKRKMNDVL